MSSLFSVRNAPSSANLSEVNDMLRMIFKIFIFSFGLWALLSTTLPHLFPQVILQRELPLDLQNKSIQLLIAHPDDEVMFFGPTIIELLKPEYENNLSVTCFSTGNDQGLGPIRADELRRSLEILGVGSNFEVIDDEKNFKDSMSIEWESNKILKYVSADTDIILTFDDAGISNHPNHISLYKAAIQSGKVVYTLKSWSFIEKYSSMLYTNVRLLIDLIELAVRINFEQDSWYQDLKQKFSNLWTVSGNINIYTDLPGSVLVVSAMMNAHNSQMAWFRYGWLLTSRYLNANELVRIQ
ncbi:CYFA0S10e00320g1_1 [Cyberlindnera fabianii]|uniref:N-acetylglucosaminylphosphatidylinositol deacetylase n=1 Tax=Cyberlindnera fabianii TaxID=36022 RepID=A0A061AY93_CYBFA|nr:CYFA0S10e00320g1_1 [Cyberlindnera fabianii]